MNTDPQPSAIPSTSPSSPLPGERSLQQGRARGKGPETNGNGRPIIGITLGDPLGIGAEVIVKALSDPHIRALGRFIIYGLDEILSYAADRAEITPYWFRVPHDQVRHIESGVVVADFDDIPLLDVGSHRPTAEGGLASLKFLDEAILAARQDRIHAIVTGPIHKISWRLAGCRRPGHTEKLADACGVEKATMMFAAGDLRVALATTHMGLFEVQRVFTIGCVFRAIEHLAIALHDWWGLAEPRIAVAGLNPHAGEDGQFGDEETRIIEPAIIMARNQGWAGVEGPFPPDTLFVESCRRRFHGIVAMYHDQGLIPVKMLAFHSAVNLTLGLPIIRTSVDHGTAFDIAGQNKADPGSMREAIRLACELARVVHARRWAPPNGPSPVTQQQERPWPIPDTPI